MDLSRRRFVFTDFDMSDERTEKWKAFLLKTPGCFGGWSIESCPTTARLHRQGMLVFKSATTVKRLVKRFPGCNIRIMLAKDCHRAWLYCTKGNPVDYVTPICFKKQCYDGVADSWSHGKLPANVEKQKAAGRAQGVKNKEVYSNAIALAKQGKWQECADSYPQIFLQHLTNLRKVEEMLAPAAKPELPECIWLYGETGTGKSRWIRRKFEVIDPETGLSNMYDKGINKWWCGYRQGQYVLIEEVDDTHKFLAYFLKRWADRYTFTGENKGGHRNAIRPPKVFVTSNFRICDIWPARDADPLRRRFREICCRAPDDDRPADGAGDEVMRPLLEFEEGGEFYEVPDSDHRVAECSLCGPYCICDGFKMSQYTA